MNDKDIENINTVDVKITAESVDAHVICLRENGYKVLEARHGGEALLMCERHREPIHLLLTDLVMPGVSGGKLGEYLTSLRKEMKVLYMSGYTGSFLIRESALMHGFAFMQKPFTPHSLTRKVREILDEPPPQ